MNAEPPISRFQMENQPRRPGYARRYTSKPMTSNSPIPMTIHGTGALSRPLEDFAEDLQDRFPTTIRVIEYHESPDGWTWYVRCTLSRRDADTLAEITDYLQIYFPTDVGGDLEVDNVTNPLFPPVPGVYFVLNASDEQSAKVKVQLVDRFGRTRRSETFHATAKQATIDGAVVPQAVLDAGLRQAVGTGDFVDANGVQVRPNDIEEFWIAAKEV